MKIKKFQQEIQKQQQIDKEMERLWREFQTVPVFEDKDNYTTRIAVDWQGWSKGTDTDVIELYIHAHHSGRITELENKHK